MKATMSKDGIPRIDVKVKFRLSAESVENAVAWCLVMDSCFHDCDNKAMAVEKALKPYWSRRAILKAIDRACRSEGDNFWTWSEGNCEVKTVLIIASQVKTLVCKKFPELKEGAIAP